MPSIDTSRSGTTTLSNARSGPDERSGGRSGCHASSPKQTTAKIRSTGDSASLEADIEFLPRPRPWVRNWPRGSGRYRLKWSRFSPAPTLPRFASSNVLYKDLSRALHQAAVDSLIQQGEHEEQSAGLPSIRPRDYPFERVQMSNCEPHTTRRRLSHHPICPTRVQS